MSAVRSTLSVTMIRSSCSDDDQILVAVVVEVTGIHTHPSFRFTTRIHRHARDQPGILESPVVPVDPELIRLPVVRDINVDPAIAIEVSGHHAERRAEFPGDTRGNTDVGERPVPIVPVKPAWHRTIDVRGTIIGPARRAETPRVGL